MLKKSTLKQIDDNFDDFLYDLKQEEIPAFIEQYVEFGEEALWEEIEEHIVNRLKKEL